MFSKYAIFLKVLDLGSFTKTAQAINYSQSAISQSIKSLEEELQTPLLIRSKEGLSLTKDGQVYLPYIKELVVREKALSEKIREMTGLGKSTITIGVFTSASRYFLLDYLSRFKETYPDLRVSLKQGDYTSISRWIETGEVDFGFINADITDSLEQKILYQDQLLLVLPDNHPLATRKSLSLRDISQLPLILLDEGRDNIAKQTFEQHRLDPIIDYMIYDDYTIVEMFKRGLGVGLLYQAFLDNIDMTDLSAIPIDEKPSRHVALAWHKWDILPLASKKMLTFILEDLS